MLLHKPGFTLAAVAVLALGIGADTAIFSLVNAFLLKPLAIHKPEELAGCFSRDTRKPDYRPFSYPNYVDLRENNNVFTSLAAHNPAMVGLAEGDTTRRLFADIVSSNYFATFGVQLFRGRTFTPEEERPGKTLRINGRLFNVVGVAPEGFTGTSALISPELYLPLGVYEQVRNDFAGRVRPLAARNNKPPIRCSRLLPRGWNRLTPERTRTRHSSRAASRG